MADGGGRRLAGGGRFEVTAFDGPPGRVVKRGPRAGLAREAAALRRLGPLGLAPRLLAARPGEIVCELLPGESRLLGGIDDRDARSLGRMLRRVHESRRTATGGLARWPSRVRSLGTYRRARIRDLLGAGGPDGALVAGVVAALPAPVPAAGGPAPFRLLHGDLAGANILWGPGPRLVDWEFWRMGDPAEDLAYLAEINLLPDGMLAAVLAGYGDAAMTARVESWRPICLLDAALWYRDAGKPDLYEAFRSRVSVSPTTSVAFASR